MLKIAARVSLLLMAINFAHAQTNLPGQWNGDGVSGKIQVLGVLTEGACRLDLHSSYQEIDLGTLSAAHFQHVGDPGIPVPFSLMLRDCISAGTLNRDDWTGNKVIDRHQPSVTFSFLAPAVTSNPGLVAVTGASGIGLAIKDENNKPVRLGFRGVPLLVTPKQDALNFTITPVRTAAPLGAGAFRASLFFYMRYD
jgi:type 1 fimbria pilin